MELYKSDSCGFILMWPKKFVVICGVRAPPKDVFLLATTFDGLPRHALQAIIQKDEGAARKKKQEEHYGIYGIGEIWSKQVLTPKVDNQLRQPFDCQGSCR